MVSACTVSPTSTSPSTVSLPLDRRQKAVEIEVLGACIANRRQQAGGKENQAGVNGAFGG